MRKKKSTRQLVGIENITSSSVQVNENYSYDIVIRAVEKGQDDASLPISSY